MPRPTPRFRAASSSAIRSWSPPRPTSVDLYPVGGRLDERSRANIRAFVERYRHYGSGAVMIQTPAGTNPNSIAVYEVRSALLAAGVKRQDCRGRLSAAERRRAPPVRVSFTGLKAIVPTKCGQWPEDLASGSSVEGWKNEPYSNFGCATQSMIAAQVDDPRDFVQPRALGPSDVAMRTRAIEAVRNGKDPGTQLEGRRHSAGPDRRRKSGDGTVNP